MKFVVVYGIVSSELYKFDFIVYRVGSQYGWSSVFTFVGLKPRLNGGYRYYVCFLNCFKRFDTTTK